IRFENEGNYPATDVVVKDLLDPQKFDISTLSPIHSTHDVVTRITGNKAEFIFENIMLPFDDENNDGYIVFKIKTQTDLIVGDSFSNMADIYFDFNYPIQTNTATTTISALATSSFDFSENVILYPN